jgi:large subunit ribosomal protein L28
MEIIGMQKAQMTSKREEPPGSAPSGSASPSVPLCTRYSSPQGRPIPLDSRSYDPWARQTTLAATDIESLSQLLRSKKVSFLSTGITGVPGSALGFDHRLFVPGRPKRFPQGGFSGSIKNCTLSKSFVGSTIQMALACELCGKKPSFGNIISHAHNVRRRRWNPNLRRVKAVIAGVHKHIRVCTACIRAGRVKKAA